MHTVDDSYSNLPWWLRADIRSKRVIIYIKEKTNLITKFYQYIYLIAFENSMFLDSLPCPLQGQGIYYATQPHETPQRRQGQCIRVRLLWNWQEVNMSRRITFILNDYRSGNRILNTVSNTKFYLFKNAVLWQNNVFIDIPASSE